MSLKNKITDVIPRLVRGATLTGIIMLCICMFFPCAMAQSTDQKISIDLQNIAIEDAIRLFAKFNHIDIILSPRIHGMVSLHLQQMSAMKALDLFLAAHGLAKWEVDNVWFIAPEQEFIRRKQEEVKLTAILDETAPLVTRTWQIHYAKADNLALLLQNNTHSLLSKRGHLQADLRTNIIYVQDTEERVAEISEFIKKLDIPVQQILIEAHLVNIDSDYERELGILFSNEESSVHYGLAVVKLAGGTFLNVQLAAMEKEGKGELLSSPSLFTANQQTASIESGEEIPYQEISKSGATGVAFKKAVLSLQVTPQIMPGHRVLLQLQLNQDKPSDRIVLGVPAISTRQMSTNILIKSGQTVVLGGIYETDKQNEQQRVPFLGKIPIVGWLFRQQNTQENKRELVIFVTPKIIES